MASGKHAAAKTKEACEAQKKAAEAASLVPPFSESEKVNASTDEAPKEDTKNVISMTQWLSIISIVVSVIGIYYKREEIKTFSI